MFYCISLLLGSAYVDRSDRCMCPFFLLLLYFVLFLDVCEVAVGVLKQNIQQFYVEIVN